MNKVILIGRLVKTPELNTTPNGVSVLSNTIAVQRKFKNQNGELESDFINFVAFGTTANVISEYVNKGDGIAIEGRIQTRSYDDQDGNKRYVTEVVVDNFFFLPANAKKERPNQEQDVDFGEEYTEDLDLPF